MYWIYSIFVAIVFFVLGLLSLLRAQNNCKKMGNIGFAAHIYMTFTMATLSLLTIALFSSTRENVKNIMFDKNLQHHVLPWVLIFGAFLFLGNAFYFTAIGDAPNPGYVRAIMSLEIVAITILSAWIYDARITMAELGGIILVCAGVAVMALL